MRKSCGRLGYASCGNPTQTLDSLGSRRLWRRPVGIVFADGQRAVAQDREVASSINIGKPGNTATVDTERWHGCRS